ncbi:MAG: hypothetical protein V4620_01190 [Bacteroidota bacterium]
MFKKLAYIFILLSIFQSCCKDDYYSPGSSGKYTLIVQVKDVNNNYINVKINTIEWLGSDYVQQVATDTATDLTLNPRAEQTQFKINHANGTDTVTFTYKWGPVAYNKGCWGENNRMERLAKGLVVTGSKPVSSINSGRYILRLN